MSPLYAHVSLRARALKEALTFFKKKAQLEVLRLETLKGPDVIQQVFYFFCWV